MTVNEYANHCHCQPERRRWQDNDLCQLGNRAGAGRKESPAIDGDPQGSLTISLGNPQPDKLPFTLSDAMGKILMDQPIRTGSRQQDYNSRSGRVSDDYRTYVEIELTKGRRELTENDEREADALCKRYLERWREELE